MNLPLPDESLFKQAMSAIEACVAQLYDEAVTVQDDYLAYVDAAEAKGEGWESRSTLQLSCVKKGNHLEMRWTGIKWYGPKNKRVSMRIHIKRNSDGFSYGIDKLKPFAKEWELPKVIETEKKLQIIRRKSKHLVNAVASIRHVTRFVDEVSSDNVEDIATD